MEDVLGVNGVKATLHIAKLSDWIDNYPPDNLDRNVDFASFSSLNAALEEVYGARGGRSLSRRSAWSMFDRALRHTSGVSTVIDMAVKVLPASLAVPQGLKAISIAFSKISDQQASFDAKGASLTFSFHRCAACWGRQADEPLCHSQAGLLEQCLRWLSGGQSYRVQEVQCVGMGNEACVFTIDKQAGE
jgi:hypothetical protein